jgi:Response regulator containing a CheY-like receiver domain and an HTH DNA-binding domain
MANILIVEDHPVVVEGLQKLLCDKGITPECLIAYTVKECLHILKSYTPDLILLDYNLPDGNGIDLCKTILSKIPSIKILAISSYKEQSLVKRMIDNGAMGYVLKNASEDEIIEAVTIVLSGKKYMCEETQNILDGKNNNSSILTRREIEVLKYISDGFTNPEIAEKLFISPLTVDSHRKNLILKLNAKNTASLITIAFQNGYL